MLQRAARRRDTSVQHPLDLLCILDPCPACLRRSDTHRMRPPRLLERGVRFPADAARTGRAGLRGCAKSTTPCSLSRPCARAVTPVLGGVAKRVWTAARAVDAARLGNPAPRQLRMAMNEKSHVSLERKVCLVCTATFDTGAILLDRGLRQSLVRYTTAGWGLCAEHQRLHDEGFVALVEVDPERTGRPSSGDRLKPEDAYRTGRLAHLKRDLFNHVFDRSIQTDQPCVFVDVGVIEKLQSMTEP